MSYLIYFNSRLLDPSEYDGSKSLSIILRRENEEGQAAFSFSSALDFSGQAYEEIKNQVLNVANPAQAFILVRIEDACCVSLAFNGRITLDAIERVCEAKAGTTCRITATIQIDNPISAALNCLKSVAISSRENLDGTITSNGEDERPAAHYAYCMETRPKFNQLLLMSLSVVANITVLLVLIPLFPVLRAVRPVVQFLTRIASGCGNVVKAPFIDGYIRNVCKLCGLNRNDTIFDPLTNGPFRFLTRIDMPFKGGANTVFQASNEYRNFNRPSLTLDQLLDTFKPINILWRLEDTAQGPTLRIFAKGNNNPPILLDLRNRQSDVISQCYTFEEKQLFAGRLYRYQQDQSDKVTNQLTPFFSDLKDYNRPVYNPILRGIETVEFLYSVPAYSDDYRVDSAINNFRRLFPSFAANYLGLPNQTMIMQTETKSSPMLANYDGFSPLESAVCQNFFDSSGRLYNGTLTMQNKPYPTLGSLFLEIDNPNSQSVVRQNFEVIFTYQCQDLINLGLYRSVLLLKDGQNASGEIEELSINPSAREITLKGVIL